MAQKCFAFSLTVGAAVWCVRIKFTFCRPIKIPYIIDISFTHKRCEIFSDAAQKKPVGSDFYNPLSCDAGTRGSQIYDKL